MCYFSIYIQYYLTELDILTLHYLFYIKNRDLRYFFLSLLCSTWAHGGIIAYYQFFFVPTSFVKECTDLLMSKSKSLLIVFVAYHHNANVNPRGYNEFISRFCVYILVLLCSKTLTPEHIGINLDKK